MSFRLVPKSVTLNDLERRNRPNGYLISPNSVALWADCVEVVEDTWILSAAEMYDKKCSFKRYIIYGAIGRGSPLAIALKGGTPLSLAKI